MGPCNWSPARSRLLGALLVSAPLLASSSTSLVLRALDPQKKPLAGARLVLSNPVSGFRLERSADAQGHFVFRNLPFNDYHLEVTAPGLYACRMVELRSSLPLSVEIVAAPGARVVVEAHQGLVEDHPAVHLDIDKSTIALSPAPVQSRAMESILLNTPGFVANDNGRFHFRGSHGQMTYLIDGIPLSDQTHATASNSLDPAQVENLEIITGGISAEYGGKPVAVVNMTTRSGLGASQGFEGEISTGFARFSTRELGLSLRGGSERFGWFLTGAGSESQRFLDPPVFENLHNHGKTGRIFSRFDWLPTDQDHLKLHLSGGRTDREVVNLPSQQARGQNQRAEMSDFNLALSWSRSLEMDRSLEASLFHRRATAQLLPSHELHQGFDPGGPDQPVWAWQERTLENWGVQAAFNQRFGDGSTVKAGLQFLRFPLQEQFRFALTQNGLVTDPDLALYAYTPAGGGHIWSLESREIPSLGSAYLQNDLHLGAFMLALGLRWDRYSFQGIVDAELQPRLGIAYRIEASRTILRASYDRLLITPDRENLGLSSSHEAAALTEDSHEGEAHGIHVVRPEVQDAFSMGLEQQLGSWGRLGLEYWSRRSRNTADVEQFLNTGVEFPMAFAHGRFKGWNLRFDMVPVEGWSAFLSLGHTRAEVQGPMVGGLQLHLGDHGHGEGSSAYVPIDHDQKLAAQAGLRFEQGVFHAQILGRYDSGLVAGDPDEALGNPDLEFGLKHIRWDSKDQVWRVKPRTIWNLTAGYRLELGRGKSLGFSADLLNATDVQTLYNFLSHRGGTHVYPPRTLALRIKLGF